VTALTNHGLARGRQRLGLARSGLARRAGIALARGIGPDDVGGNFRAWLLGAAMRKPGSTARVHGGQVFIFGTELQLVTVFAVPADFRRAAEKVAKRKASVR
jgi:hypothetical protein